MAEDRIILYHKGLEEAYEVNTEAQAEILAEVGWAPATKAQREAFFVAEVGEEEK